MTILVIDGQGGKLGKTLVENIKKSFPHLEIMAVGTNSAASDVMRRAGADRVATGENPVIVACRSAQIIVGPIGIAIADALMGEISPRHGKRRRVKQCLPCAHPDESMQHVCRGRGQKVLRHSGRRHGAHPFAARRNGEQTMNNTATATARTASPVRKLTYSALFLALAMVLPFLTGQIPEIGSMLCPMHIPALLCGFMCGWPWGLAVGFISPLLRSMSGMPPIWIAIPMAFEMATYGAIAGLLYRKLPKTGWRIYASLISAMVAGRLVWGLVKFLLAGLQGTEFSLALFLSGAVTTAIPGIILQLILIPILVVVMERTNMALDV